MEYDDNNLASFIKSEVIKNTIVKPIVNDVLENSFGPGFVKFNEVDYLNQVQPFLDQAKNETIINFKKHIEGCLAGVRYKGSTLCHNHNHVDDYSSFMPDRIFDYIPNKLLFCMKDPSVINKMKSDISNISKELVCTYVRDKDIVDSAEIVIPKFTSEVVDNALANINVVQEVATHDTFTFTSILSSLTIPEVVVYGTIIIMGSVFVYNIYQYYFTGVKEVKSFVNVETSNTLTPEELVIHTVVYPEKISEYLLQNVDYIVLIIQFMML